MVHALFLSRRGLQHSSSSRMLIEFSTACAFALSEKMRRGNIPRGDNRTITLAALVFGSFRVRMVQSVRCIQSDYVAQRVVPSKTSTRQHLPTLQYPPAREISAKVTRKEPGLAKCVH